MPESSPERPGTHRRDAPAPVWHWPAEHQPLIAILVVLLLTTVGLHGWSLYRSGGLVDIETAPSRSYAFQVELNSATGIELQTIPGIGPQLAQRIVRYRERHGPFQSRDQLLQVSGIGPRTVERIAPFLQPLPHDRPLPDDASGESLVPAGSDKPSSTSDFY